MPDILKDYFDALERLKRGKPENVPQGTKITNDSVSLEAGRKKGTIKKSRPVFSDLIEAIEAAGAAEGNPQDEMRARLDQSKAKVARYRMLWEEALAREVSLVKQLQDVREELKNLKAGLISGKVSMINTKKPR